MSRIICGKNSILEAIKNNIEIEIIYCIKPLNISNRNIPYKITTKEYLDELTNNLNHQGLVAIVKEDFKYFSIEIILKEKPKIVLILDHLEDSYNFGSIIRTANAAGIKHIIIPANRSVEINSAVLKVSSGGFVDMKVIKVNSLQSTIENLKKNNYWIYSSVLDKNAKNYQHISYNNPLCLVVGNESKGVSKTIIKASDELIYIPMSGTVQSLNVSVATAILLFSIVSNIK